MSTFRTMEERVPLGEVVPRLLVIKPRLYDDEGTECRRSREVRVQTKAQGSQYRAVFAQSFRVNVGGCRGCLRSFVPFLRAHLGRCNRVIIAPICLPSYLHPLSFEFPNFPTNFHSQIIDTRLPYATQMRGDKNITVSIWNKNFSSPVTYSND